MADIEINTDAFDATVELAAAYASNSNHRLTPEEYSGLIRTLFTTLSDLSGTASAPADAEPELDVVDDIKSRAEIRKSIGATHLTSFLDGKPYRSLKRHLSANGMSPNQYRARFGLDAGYPMTHPEYSAQRSAMAKSIGLGSKGRQANTRTPAAPAAAPKASKPKRGPKTRTATKAANTEPAAE